MANERILIVDDDPQIPTMLTKVLLAEGFTPLTAGSAEAALALVRQAAPDLVLLDVRLPDANGMDLLIKELLPALGPYRVILLSGSGTRTEAEDAVRAGAFDYLTKPISIARLLIAVRNSLRLHELGRELKEVAGGMARPMTLRDLIGTSPQMLTLIAQIKQVAPFDVPVLILGESGTGKELVARVIHTLSPRCKGPFVAIDCGALPETLVEAEIFGYERGAFSGAVQAKPGKLERADGGTLLLDEIANIPPSIQPKLLRVLQSQEVERLGGTQLTRVNARVISATNADLDAMMAEGGFRMDLYHRLNTVVLKVPPLRARVGDISLLANYALMLANRAFNKNVRVISPDAMAVLESYEWPGNVRELENCIRSAVIMADQIMESDHLPAQIRAKGRQRSAGLGMELRPGESLTQIRRRAAEEAERGAIVLTLAETGRNKAEAARRLKVDYKTLYMKMRQYGIQLPQKPPDSAEVSE